MLFTRAPKATLKMVLTRRPVLIRQLLQGTVLRSPTRKLKDSDGVEFLTSERIVVRIFTTQAIVVFGADSIEHARTPYPLRHWLYLAVFDELITRAHGWRFSAFGLLKGDTVEFETRWA